MFVDIRVRAHTHTHTCMHMHTQHTVGTNEMLQVELKADALSFIAAEVNVSSVDRSTIVYCIILLYRNYSSWRIMM